MNNNIEKRKVMKKTRVKRKLFFRKIVFLLILISLIIFGLNRANFFTVKGLAVEGAESIDQEEIIRRSGLVIGANYFEFSEKSRVADISSIPRIKSVDIKFSPFGDTVIKIEERVPVLKVRNYSDYFIFDEELRCIDVGEDVNDELINLNGINEEAVELGKFLFASKEMAVEKNSILQVLKDPNLNGTIKEITVNENNLVILNKDGIEIDFGAFSNGEYKLTLLGEILKDIANTNKNVVKIEMERGNNPIVTLGDSSEVKKEKEKLKSSKDEEEISNKDKKSNSKEKVNNKSSKENSKKEDSKKSKEKVNKNKEEKTNEKTKKSSENKNEE